MRSYGSHRGRWCGLEVHGSRFKRRVRRANMDTRERGARSGRTRERTRAALKTEPLQRHKGAWPRASRRAPRAEQRRDRIAPGRGLRIFGESESLTTALILDGDAAGGRPRSTRLCGVACRRETFGRSTAGGRHRRSVRVGHAIQCVSTRVSTRVERRQVGFGRPVEGAPDKADRCSNGPRVSERRDARHGFAIARRMRALGGV